mmetsp:Transcript_21805/g.64333  ORF Transcript_21805/g.64333 Transcript_21805/m.64333 type:complete len:244 (-) Transcript_21805:468-1199(-)
MGPTGGPERRMRVESGDAPHSARRAFAQAVVDLAGDAVWLSRYDARQPEQARACFFRGQFESSGPNMALDVDADASLALLGVLRNARVQELQENRLVILEDSGALVARPTDAPHDLLGELGYAFLRMWRKRPTHDPTAGFILRQRNDCLLGEERHVHALHARDGRDYPLHGADTCRTGHALDAEKEPPGFSARVEPRSLGHDLLCGHRFHEWRLVARRVLTRSVHLVSARFRRSCETSALHGG